MYGSPASACQEQRCRALSALSGRGSFVGHRDREPPGMWVPNWQVMLANAKALKRAYPRHLVRDLFSEKEAGQIPGKTGRDECGRKDGTEG